MLIGTNKHASESIVLREELNCHKLAEMDEKENSIRILLFFHYL